MCGKGEWFLPCSLEWTAPIFEKARDRDDGLPRLPQEGWNEPHVDSRFRIVAEVIEAFKRSSTAAGNASLAPESRSPALHKVADHVFPRRGATLLGVALGILLGMGNVVIGLIFPSWLATLGLLAAAILLVLVLHEGLHGAVAWLFGYRPIFGVEPPLVFTTFDEKIRRDHLVVIALAPLVILDTVFIAAYLMVPGEVFWDLCFAANTLGAIGDVWIVTRLLMYPSDTLFQDTKSGVEAWASVDPA